MKFYYIATVDADSRIFDKMIDHKKGIIKLVTEKDYNAKVRSACLKTVDKAIEFETESLLDEAIEKSKKGLTSGAKEFGLKCKLNYYANIKNPTLYSEAANDISKIFVKEDPSQLKLLITQMQTSYKKDDKIVKQSVEISKKYYKKVKSIESIIVYAKSLILVEKYKDATKLLKEGIKEASEKGESARSLELLLNAVEKKNS